LRAVARYDRRASFHKWNGDYERAIADCSEAIRIRPTASRYASRADAYMKSGDTARAFLDFDAAISFFPCAEAYKSRAAALQSMGEYDRAITDYGAAMRRTSGLFNVTSRKIDLGYLYRARADAHVAKRDYDLAIADCDRFIDLVPRTSYAYEKRGDIYSLKGDAESAIADYTEMIDIESVGGRPYVGFAKRAHVHLSMGELKQAIADYSESIRLNPTAEGHVWRGDAYRRTGDEVLAIADYDAAIAIAEVDSEPKREDQYTSISRNQARFRRAYAYMWGGVARQRKGDWPGSKTDVSRAEAIAPGVAEQFSAYL
jgi:tetratricopeptide (TPR) repeat protein